MKTFKLELISLLLLLPITLFAVAVPRASAFDLFYHCVTESDGTKVCGACADNKDSPACTQATSQGGTMTNRLTGTGSILNIASGILALVTGAAAIIMIIVSGITMATSAGNAEAVASSRRRLIYSLIGLIVVVLSWTIIRFITDKLVQ